MNDFIKNGLTTMFLISPLYLNGMDLEIGLIGNKLYYEEKDINGKYLDSETSNFTDLYGFDLRIKQKLNDNLNFKSQLNYIIGSTEYDGSTMIGNNKLNFTHEDVKKTNYIMFLEYNIFRNKELETNFEFGLGFNNWFRGNSNYSIQEIYRWYYTTIGLNNNFKINDNYDIGLNLNYNKSFKGNLYTNMLGAEKFDLDNINGYKVSIPLTSKITKDIYFVLEYAYEYIEIGKSDFKSALFSDGIRRNVYEPDSTTNSNTISTRIKFSF